MPEMIRTVSAHVRQLGKLNFLIVVLNQKQAQITPDGFPGINISAGKLTAAKPSATRTVLVVDDFMYRVAVPIYLMPWGMNGPVQEME
ncbi:hypothetical protein D3C75_935680 [compost metagenome]